MQKKICFHIHSLKRQTNFKPSREFHTMQVENYCCFLGLFLFIFLELNRCWRTMDTVSECNNAITSFKKIFA